SLTKNKLDYKLLVSICCVAACVLSVTGVDNIITFAYPILSFIYPIAITLVLYSVFFARLVKNRKPYIAALLASTLIAVCYLLRQLTFIDNESIALLNR